MKMEASVDPQCRGPDWMPITPKTGSLFHAETQTRQLSQPNGLEKEWLGDNKKIAA